VNAAINRFSTGSTLTHASAKAALAAGVVSIEAGATGVDCTPLAEFDSSALAVLLAWRRAAHTRGIAFEIANLPVGLASLAQVYGIDALLTVQRQHSPEGAVPSL
jgi:phospholipid transport system transporter-binding protein